MCHLISIAVSRSTVDVTSHFRAHGLHAEESSNSSVRAALGTLGVYDVTDQGCSCSLHAPDGGDGNPTQHDTLRRRYAKRGWTTAKIERTVESASRARVDSQPSARTRFIAALDALCASGATIRLLCHDYAGRFDEERFTIGPPLRVSVRALSQQAVAVDAVINVHS